VKWYYMWPSVPWGRLAAEKPGRCTGDAISAFGFMDDWMAHTLPFVWRMDNWGGLCSN